MKSKLGDRTLIAQSPLRCLEKSQDEGRSTFIYYTEWNMMCQVQKTTSHVLRDTYLTFVRKSKLKDKQPPAL